jgi:hypothetical protein
MLATGAYAVLEEYQAGRESLVPRRTIYLDRPRNVEFSKSPSQMEVPIILMHSLF